MNREIEILFTGFKVDNVDIPVSFMVYEGHGEPYVVYRQYDKDNSYSCDDDIAGYVTYYDFDIYGQGNIAPIIEAIKSKLKGAGWTWQPRRDSPAFYEADTRYFHKTICFAYPIQEVEPEPEPTSETENENNIGG